MEDADFCREQQQEALKRARQATLLNERSKFTSAAAAWGSMAARKSRKRGSIPLPEVADE